MKKMGIIGLMRPIGHMGIVGDKLILGNPNGKIFSYINKSY